MDDDEFLRAFPHGWPQDRRFGHYEHLRLAWLVIDRHGLEAAPYIVGESIRRFAASQGKAALYNETLTRFWVRLIAHVREARAATSIDDAIALVPLLLDKNVALKHWTRSALYGPEARAGWVEPDFLPLPF
jgi:CDP-diacylglycerol--glycerol-3-phosphate 3-phosphatidyltransferase